jgi:hypothetical protein
MFVLYSNNPAAIPMQVAVVIWIANPAIMVDEIVDE